MKAIKIVLLIVLTGSVCLANTAPVVSNVTASQRTDGSGIVDITYNLSAVSSCTVSLQVSSDGGSTWTVQATSFLPGSHIGANISPGNRTIFWNSKMDLPGAFGPNYRVKVIADDGLTPSDMVLIPGGTFEMGDSLDGVSSALPVHSVTLSPFYMSRYHVTNGQYRDFLNSARSSGTIYVSNNLVYGTGNNQIYCDTYPSAWSQINWNGSTFSVRTKGGRSMANDPMVSVSWYGAVAYANWRSQQEGKQPCYNLSTWACDFIKKGYRLPTEAQWEYAARGGLAGRRFPWGDTINHSHANYVANGSAYSYDTSPYTTWTYHPTWNDGTMPYTSPVGSFPPNGYGLYDMAGNVWAWCNDWHGSYTSSSKTNPTGPATGTYRVIRGSSWGHIAGLCRVAMRGGDAAPFARSPYGGFRLSLDF